MAKMLRRERAWQLYATAFLENRCRRPEWSHKAKRPEHSRVYWQLVRACQELGMSVWLYRDLGEARDHFGRPFTIGGTWESWHRRINLVQRDFKILAHELAHAVDYILSGHRPPPEQELVASAAGFMLTCERLGVRSPSFDVRYAKRQGATAEHFIRLQDYILLVFDEMNVLMSG